MKMSYVLLLLIMLLISFKAVATVQNDNALDYIVLTSNDTLYGTVKHINEKSFFPRLYKKIRFINTEGKRKKYRRKDVQSFRVNGTVYKKFWLSQTSKPFQIINPIYDITAGYGDLHFLKVISEGKLNHYHLEWWEQGDKSLWYKDLIKREDESFLMSISVGIFGLKKKKLINYFSDCKELQKKIELKKVKTVEQVVDFYNNECRLKS